MDDLVVGRGLVVPGSELRERFSRSGGPGGQHVNTSATRVELLWDVASSTAVDDHVREMLLARLASRLDADGVIRVVVEATRSQLENRRIARERLARLLAAAVRPRRERLATRPSLEARSRRLAEKRRRAEIKRDRRAPGLGDG